MDLVIAAAPAAPAAPVSLDAAYEELVRSHRAALERLARRLAHTPEDAEDLLQESLLDAYLAFHRFRQDGRFYTWFARIMTNNHLDRLRRNRHTVLSLDAYGDEGNETLEVPDESANPERVLLHDMLDDRLQQALASLQPHHRTTVILCDLDGATYEEAAAAQACPVGTIRSRLHRAHKGIEKFLKAWDAGQIDAQGTPVRRARRRQRAAA